VQEESRRRLHVVAIGGGSFREVLGRYFDSWTVIDSIPFGRAMHRQRAGEAGPRLRFRAQPSANLDELLEHNTRAQQSLMQRATMRRGPPR
jgi:hypothetical protein